MESKNLVKIYSPNIIMLCVTVGKCLNSEEYQQYNFCERNGRKITFRQNEEQI